MEIRMVRLMVEKQGRIIIPKSIREQLNLRTGENISIEVKDNKIILKPLKDPQEFSAQLKGCIKESKINPLELKKIWSM